MAAAAKPSAKGAVGAITRKIGPLPLWAWFVGALAAYYLYAKVRGSSSTTAAVQTSSGTPGAAATDASGNVGSGSTSPDNMNSDLLSALLQGQAQSEQSLLDALSTVTYYAAGAYGGYGGAAPGSVSTAGTATTQATTPAQQPATAAAPTAPTDTQQPPSQPTAQTVIDSMPIWIAPEQQHTDAAAPAAAPTAVTYPTFTLSNPDYARPIKGAVGQV